MNIWIIGASTGIGLALAQLYANKGHNVWISARNQALLDEVCEAQKGLHPLPVDITNEASIQDAVNHLSQSNTILDKIIINAGTCEYTDSYQIEDDKFHRVMNTNFFGAISVTKYSLPLLRKAKHSLNQAPQLIFVSSSVTYLALPRAGAYGASKAALRYFAETLRADLVHEGIDVRIVSPGFVKTPLTDVNDFPMPFILSADEAAKRIHNALKSQRFDIAFPKRFVWLMKLVSCLPERLGLKLVANASRHDPEKVADYE